MTGECMPDVRYAGFADRTAAFILDAIIVSTLFFSLIEGVAYVGKFIGPLFFAGTAAMFGNPEMPVIIGYTVAGSVLLALMCWLYSAGVTSSSYGGTFGKMIMGMKVVDTSGNPLSFWHATVRFIAKILAGLILFIGFFMIHFSPTKQGLHDRFAGTYVVYVKKDLPVTPDAGPTVTRTLAEQEEKKEEESRSNTRSSSWQVCRLSSWRSCPSSFLGLLQPVIPIPVLLRQPSPSRMHQRSWSHTKAARMQQS